MKIVFYCIKSNTSPKIPCLQTYIDKAWMAVKDKACEDESTTSYANQRKFAKLLINLPKVHTSIVGTRRTCINATLFRPYHVTHATSPSLASPYHYPRGEVLWGKQQLSSKKPSHAVLYKEDSSWKVFNQSTCMPSLINIGVWGTNMTMQLCVSLVSHAIYLADTSHMRI